MSSKVAIRFEPTTVKRRSLCGSSQDRCRCAARPEGKRRKQKTTSSTPVAACSDSPKAWHSTRLLAGQPQHHRDVVRAERPERVLVGAQLAEVEAVAVDVVDVAELAGVDELLEPLEARGGTRAGARPSACGRCRRGGLDHRLGVGHRLGERLLDEAVLARLEHAHARAAACVGTGVAIATASSSRVGEQLVERAVRRARREATRPTRSSRSGEPSQSQASSRVRAARRSCAPGSGPSSRARPRRSAAARSRRGPRAARRHHGVDLLGARARGPSAARGWSRASSSVTGSSAPGELAASAAGGAPACGSSRAPRCRASPSAGGQLVGVLATHHVEVVDVLGARGRPRQAHELAEPGALVGVGGRAAAPRSSRRARAAARRSTAAWSESRREL